MPNFNDPGTGGDKLPLDDLLGALLLVDVHEQMGEIQTSFGPATPIRADVFVLDGTRKGDEFRDALIFPRKLQGQLRGSVGAKVIGRLGRGTAKAGQSPPWELSPATAEDKQIGERWLTFHEARVAEAEEPFEMVGDLEQLTRAERMLAEIATAEDAVAVQRYAEAARVYAQQARLGTGAMNHATSIKLRAERRMAEVVGKGQAEGSIATKDRGRGSVRDPDTSTLAELGVDRRRLAEARLLLDYYSEDEIVSRVADATERAVAFARITMIDEARQADAKARYLDRQAGWDAGANLDGDRVDIRLGDFRDVLADLEPGSVDAIVTDPPYPDEFLPLWSDVAEFAANVLRPGAPLIAWSGLLRLPDVLRRVTEHLTYQWLVCLDLPGINSRVRPVAMIQTWKPIILATSNGWGPHPWHQDRVISPRQDQDLYEWQQNADPAAELIARYVPDGGLVVDPFTGVGSFAVAAISTGRRFIGAELDTERYEQARQRAAEAMS